MNARERMLAAINHQPVDRIPTDIWATGEVMNQHILPFGTPGEVRDEVRTCIDTLAASAALTCPLPAPTDKIITEKGGAALARAMYRPRMHPFREAHRRAVRERPFPPEWTAVIQSNVPYFSTLTPDEQHELHSLIHVFLDEKSFEGCGGLEMTDEIRVTIAAQACILLLHRETDDYPRLRSILVYPHPYRTPSVRQGPGHLVLEGEETHLGESWRTGAIVLAWDAVRGGASDVQDGHNVVYHEFAHQLDAEDGEINGAPSLPHRSMYTAWARVLSAEYENLIRDAHASHRTVLDPYGTVNPAEFFAVSTEAFFEKPVQLARHHPKLYDELRLFYNQDPAARLAGGGH